MEKEQLAKWLLKYDEQTLQIALMYATNYLKYGVDVTEKWDTAVQQQAALKKAEEHGYIEGRNSFGIVRCKEQEETELCDRCGRRRMKSKRVECQ